MLPLVWNEDDFELSNLMNRLKSKLHSWLLRWCTSKKLLLIQFHTRMWSQNATLDVWNIVENWFQDLSKCHRESYLSQNGGWWSFTSYTVQSAVVVRDSRFSICVDYSYLHSLLRKTKRNHLIFPTEILNYSASLKRERRFELLEFFFGLEIIFARPVINVNLKCTGDE